MMIWNILFVSLVVIYTAAAAVIDLRQHRIPNYLTVPAAVLGLLFHTFMPAGEGVLYSLGGFAIGFGLLLLPWLLGGGGMGDVKLLAALGAWLGPYWMLLCFTLSTVLALGIAGGMMLRSASTEGMSRTRTRFLESAQGKDREGNKRKVKRAVPFAVPVALSTWLLLAWIVSQGQL